KAPPNHFQSVRVGSWLYSKRLSYRQSHFPQETIDCDIEDGMKQPRNFFKPLATGAPAPLRELPVRLERLIHFVPPHVETIRAKVPDLIGQVDVILGNLEDAVPADAKAAARQGFIAMAKGSDFGATGLWT